MSENIVYATDENYWLPLYVSLYSLLEHNGETEFDIYVLSKERNEDFFDNIGALRAVHDGFSIEFVEVSDEEFSAAPEPKWFNEGIYYRLLVGSLLPVEGENVLYLDCDTVVDGSLSGLFDVDMDEDVAAGVPEPSNKSFWLGLSADASFYNTGVLYINLENWEEHGIEQKSIEFIEESDSFVVPLQQTLNTVLHETGMWKPLEPRYNAMVGGWIGTRKSKKFDRQVDPTIIHYYGSTKPWEYTYDKAYENDWWKVLEKTPCEGYEPEGKTRRARLESTVREPYRKARDLARYVAGSLR